MLGQAHPRRSPQLRIRLSARPDYAPESGDTLLLHVAYDHGNPTSESRGQSTLMRHQQGPTKRMAPSPSPETCCPHSYLDDDGLVLDIECNSCAGAHDLSNPRCYAGVLNIMASGAQPDSIVLRRYIHKRYRGEAVRTAVSAASELASLRRGIVGLEPPSDRKCRTCPASAHKVLLQARLRLVENPMSPPMSREAMTAGILEMVRGDACEKAYSCISRALQTSR